MRTDQRQHSKNDVRKSSIVCGQLDDLWRQHSTNMGDNRACTLRTSAAWVCTAAFSALSQAGACHSPELRSARWSGTTQRHTRTRSRTQLKWQFCPARPRPNTNVLCTNQTRCPESDNNENGKDSYVQCDMFPSLEWVRRLITGSSRPVRSPTLAAALQRARTTCQTRAIRTRASSIYC
jgi:hypothetical protein